MRTCCEEINDLIIHVKAVKELIEIEDLLNILILLVLIVLDTSRLIDIIVS